MYKPIRIIIIILILFTIIKFFIFKKEYFEDENSTLVSNTFYKMFSQPSPWIGSIRGYDLIKREVVNKKLIEQL